MPFLAKNASQFHKNDIVQRLANFLWFGQHYQCAHEHTSLILFVGQLIIIQFQIIAMFIDMRFDLYLAGKFSSLGACVARSPGVFIIVPLLVTLLMGSGVQQFSFTSDVFYLFVPAHAKSIHDRVKLQELFPENLTQ